MEGETTEQKWRICQNFAEVNKVMEIAPMPQGNIRMKQQRLSGHKYVSVFNFASGFYAMKVAEESKPYTAFYVEGRGYFWYKRMPFGLTGVPSTFANMTATHLHDLLTDGMMELFMDDGGSAVDTFEEGMNKLRTICQRIRDSDLSLSTAKSQFFMTEAVFAGARVGPKGVAPDLTKLTAIINWERPADALNLASFLGITGHYRDLIRNYARIEEPLRNLLRAVELPASYSKSTYHRIMEQHKLAPHWNETHTKCFTKLKVVITQEPVLQNPHFDGTPFIVTSDGCKSGFAAVLSQKCKVTLPNGKVVERLHPIAFTSKRTSKTEEKYKPFLLEFAALKFTLDKFADIIWGSPVEIETNCQALHDVLLNDKLNATHTRWQDSIISYNITDVRHVPGKINVVTDGISRKWEGTPSQVGDGSEWTVSKDWEERTGLTNDILEVDVCKEHQRLRARFEKEPLFAQVVDAIFGIQNKSTSICDKRRARHRAEQYLIEEGKLW